MKQNESWNLEMTTLGQYKMATNSNLKYLSSDN